MSQMPAARWRARARSDAPMGRINYHGTQVAFGRGSVGNLLSTVFSATDCWQTGCTFSERYCGKYLNRAIGYKGGAIRKLLFR